MRTCLVLVFALAACKDSKPPTPPVTNPGSGSTVTATPDSAGSAAPAGEIVELPKLSGKPPAKTTKPHTKAQLEALAQLEFKDFDKDIRKVDKGFFEVKQRTKTRPKIGVTITVLPCMKCEPNDLALWQQHKEWGELTLSPELRSRPDTTFEISEASLGGQKLISIYHLGYFFGKDANGNPEGAYSNAAVLHYNDGVNRIRVIAAYVDDPVGSKEALAAAAPKEDLQRVALAFLDAYTQKWGN